jgi:biopolymer transport protein ExbD
MLERHTRRDGSPRHQITLILFLLILLIPVVIYLQLAKRSQKSAESDNMVQVSTRDQSENILTITLMTDGSLLIEEDSVSWNGLQTILKDRLNQDSTMSVRIKADQQVKMGEISRLQHILQENRIKHVLFESDSSQ